MNLADLLREESRWTLTENGAEALDSTGSALLDMYSSLSAMRGRDEIDLIRKFELAFQEDPLGAMRCLFYTRDVRGGQGERKIFRNLIRYAADRHADTLRKNLEYIPEFGRWDDLYQLIGTPLEEDMWALVKAQLLEDKKGMEEDRPVSLLAKWLKKADSRTAVTKELGIYSAKKLGMSVYEYKRLCNALRKHIKVVEVRMSAKEWDAIDYEAVPSRAMMTYRKAFLRRDKERFAAYLESVEQGKAVIHAGTLYPYDIVRKVFRGERNAVLEAQWNALPNYVEEGDNVLVMADVSASMTWEHDAMALYSSIGLALYFAERNSGPYKNLYITFSSEPAIVEVKGSDLWSKLNFIKTNNIGYSTNLYKAMELILAIAVKNHCSQSELPKALVVVTDMEFDPVQADEVSRKTFSKKIKELYKAAGYEAPVLVLWNVNARKDTFHADAEENGVILVGGHSASTFRDLMIGLKTGLIDPVVFMYNVLNGPRYACITA